MKAIFVFIVALLLVSCGRVSQQQPTNAVLESNDTLTLELCQASENEVDAICLLELYLPPTNGVNSLAMVLIAEAVHIPVGSSLVLKTFEDKWHRRSNEEGSDSRQWSNDLFRHFSRQYNFYENSATMIDKKYFRPFFNITPCLWIARNKPLNEQFRAIAIPIARYQHFALYSFLTEGIKLDCRPCDNWEFVQIQSLASISNNRVIDNLVVAYTFEDGVGGGESQFFHYDGKRIHIKGFGNSGDGWTIFGGYQKFQITTQGRFIRYYEQNGFLENDNERGLVKNHTREGKWVDTSGSFYIEVEYKNGLPVSRRYYEMLREFTEEDFEIPSSRRRGELLYTETFENGRLVRRELFNNLWDWDMDFFN